MSGRWTNWFLEEGLSKAVYDKHKQDVEEMVRSSTWRAILRLYVDFRFWEEGKAIKNLFSPIEASWYGNAKAHWVHFGDVAGKIMYLHWINNVEHVRFITSDENQAIDIPVKAIVSTSSAGFPKVAYSAEQYLVGYLGWLEAFREANQGHYKNLNDLQAQLAPVNFSELIYARVKDLSRYLLSESHPKEEIQLWIDHLEKLMIEEMVVSIPSRCKPPYHHVVEWHIDEKVFQKDTPLIHAYLKIRAQFPSIVMGRGFIEVPGVSKKIN